MQRLEVSGAVRLIYKSLGVKGLIIRVLPPPTGQHCVISGGLPYYAASNSRLWGVFPVSCSKLQDIIL